MRIELKTNGLTLTNSLSRYAYKKIKKLSKFSSYISTVHVTLTKEAANFTAQGRFIVDGKELVRSSASDDLYSAIDKLERQVIRAAQEIKSHKKANASKTFAQELHQEKAQEPS